MKRITPKSIKETLLPKPPPEDIVHLPEPTDPPPRVSAIDFGKVQPQSRLPKLFKVYPKEQCAQDGCDNFAVGSDIYCKYHGGDPIIRENLLQNPEIPISMLGTYKPDYHPMAYLNYAKQGMSPVEIAAEFGVSTTILKSWSEQFLDFNTVYEIGAALHEAYYISTAKENMDNRGFNTALFKLVTGNVIGWSDKTESKSLNIHAGVLVVPERMTEDEWEAENGSAR